MPFGFFFDPTMLLLIPALLFAGWAQLKVKSTYAKFSQVGTRSGLSGAEVAARILRDSGIDLSDSPSSNPGRPACGLEAIPGELTDHYDPRDRVLRLSDGIYSGRSVAALGIAAHEVGHAVQHARAFAPLMLRNVVYPVCSFGSMLAWPLFFVGFFFHIKILIPLGIALYILAVFFTVLTLPVEFDASRRALKCLSSGGYLTTDELAGARKVLTAAALTYVAATAMAILELVRMLILARGRD
ncbi:MAG: zinc metallopeptidase [Candidatus Hydrogenedentes bacterium]|nr:zinc metallopeptidase [Candidatus Hydrogenedentota bacterium]